MIPVAALKLGIVGFAQWPAEREIAPQSARRCGAVDLFADRAERDGRDPGRFEDVSERTDRTRAQGSDRRQQHHIDGDAGHDASRRAGPFALDGPVNVTAEQSRHL